MRAAAASAYAAMTEQDLERLAETTRLTFSVPEMRARAVDEFTRTIEQIGGALAVRAGREPDDFAARVMAGAMIGVIMAVTLPRAADKTWTWARCSADRRGPGAARERAAALRDRGQHGATPTPATRPPRRSALST